MSNVRHIRALPDFDAEITEVIHMVNPSTAPEGIPLPFQTLLEGPASYPDADPEPAQTNWPAFGIVFAGYLLGVVQTLLIVRFFG